MGDREGGGYGQRLLCTGVFIPMVKKVVFGSVLIEKRRYWPKGVPAEEILQHMQNKEVGDVETVQGLIRGKIYNIMAIKEPNYVMLIITTYGTLEDLEGSDIH